MLGEILGRSAGLACTELLLVLFFLSRKLLLGSTPFAVLLPPGDTKAPS